MEIKTEFDLMFYTAQALAGKPVILRLKHPSTKGNHGECHAGPDGQIYIDMVPMLPDKIKLLVLCHEAAHARLHTFKPSMVYKLQSGTLDPNPDSPKERVRESQADALAKKWMDYAKQHGGDDIQDQLIALLNLYKRGKK